MWSKLTHPWQVCLEQTWQAYCQGTIPVGAVITSAEGDIIAVGRNRILDESAPLGQLAMTPIAHAEINVLAQLHHNDPNRSRYALYTALEPCPMCAGAIYMSGIKEVHFAACDGYAGSTNMYGATPYLSVKPMRVYGPLPELEHFVATLHIEYFLREQLENSRKSIAKLLEESHTRVPRSFAAGQALFATEALRMAVLQGWSAEQAYDYVTTL